MNRIRFLPTTPLWFARDARPRLGITVFAIVIGVALIGAPSSHAQTEPQNEPPPAVELSPEVSPTVDPGEGSVEGEDADLSAGETGDAVATEGEEPETDTSALFYMRRCSVCHTIGRGDLIGPDLLPATRWPHDELQTAVRRMEKNVGPMTEEEIEGLVDLLQGDDLQARLDEAASARVAEMAAKLDPGSPKMGKRLFFGEVRLENGGVACFACHSVSGRGGNMAVDLSLANRRLGGLSLLSATEEPSFPLMKAAYRGSPVSAQEAVHIAAFLEEAATEAERAGFDGSTPVPAEQLGVLHGVAGGVVLLSLGSIAFVARKRRAGTRSRLVRESFRR